MKKSRSETVTIRLDPKTKYLSSLVALTQRRTLSSFIEWVLVECLKNEKIDFFNGKTIWSLSDSLWDVDESDRFVKLASQFPELLNFEDQCRWKEIRSENT